MQRDELVRYLNESLSSARFRDYCPNGLQVEGCGEVRQLVCGVTASLALIEAAIARNADTLLVHHGWFWRGEEGGLTGFRRQRMARLLAHDINLIAYHLPLDAHAEWGNNAQLARHLGWSVEGRFGEQEIGFLGRPAPDTPTASALAAALTQQLARPAQLLGNGQRGLQRIAWCSGGAQGYFEQAILAGADAYVTGEVSEQTFHLAQETGIPCIAIGHHASERYGVQALAAHLQKQFGLACDYVEIENPV
ncbi:MAG: Nif3-like dinuclear metal center hexameric protein [Sterolibacterium sp.]|jgi:dinuclear metal center YbgI/SA1388 family protein|nr:Nif3-like dinuclear metal center hexameric protein [Sterolibacterium sp.]